MSCNTVYTITDLGVSGNIVKKTELNCYRKLFENHTVMNYIHFLPPFFVTFKNVPNMSFAVDKMDIH